MDNDMCQISAINVTKQETPRGANNHPGRGWQRGARPANVWRQLCHHVSHESLSLVRCPGPASRGAARRACTDHSLSRRRVLLHSPS